jgi:hypothetical protein
MVPNEEALRSVEEDIRVPDRNQLAKDITAFMTEAPKEFVIHFMNKVWLLLRADRKKPFLIGDNPLTLQNLYDAGPYGNIGLALPGIEIYFPLSPLRALALWSLEHQETFQQAAANLRFLSQAAPLLVASHIRDPFFIEQIAVAMDTGQPLTYQPDNILNFNSLQIFYAERYVFSSIDDFTLVREMIQKYPEIRTGPRAKLN